MRFKFFRHLHMVNKHRFLVFVHCVKCGLFWRGLTHDLSKYSPVEFFESVKYYTGKGSPIANCRKQNGYSLAWFHHKGRNKHHFEYWYDNKNKEQINIPYKYAVEHICDEIAASKCYNGKDYAPTKLLEYFNKHLNSYLINDRMKAFYLKVYTDMSNFGENYILNKKYLKSTYSEIVLNGSNNSNN